MRHLLALAIVLSLAAAACGGSTTDAADEAATTTEATSTTATGAPSTTAPTTTEATTTTAEPTTTAVAIAETDPNDPTVVGYCASVNEVDARLDAADFSDPVALEDALTFQIDTMSSTEIPSEIQDDITTMLTISDEYYQLLETVDFDFIAVQDDIAAIFENPSVEAAGDNLDDFEAEYCPIPVDDDFEPDGNPLGLTEADVLDLLQDPIGRQGIAEGMIESTGMTLEQANCFLDETDPNVVAALFSIGVGDQTQVDPEVSGGMFEGLAACDMSIDMFG